MPIRVDVSAAAEEDDVQGRQPRPWVFEDEVRRIARHLWPAAEFQGAAIADGKERDGIFVTEENVHLVEATCLPTYDKAEIDATKLAALATRMRSEYPTKVVKCWFVTQREPTAHQREAVNSVKTKSKTPIVALSLAQLQAKLINVRSYLDARGRYAFGSIASPDESSPHDPPYVPMDILEAGGTEAWTVDRIFDEAKVGARFVLLGDYGAGKSMSLREVYRRMHSAHFRNETTRFPVYLNLRDHVGQTNPAEVLERHARNIGFESPSHLVRAWRAGYAILILDGFDELVTLGIQGMWRKLKDVRYRAMTAVRSLVDGTPRDVGLLIAGRAHYFDNDDERKAALSVGRNYHELTLSDFSESQVSEYLARTGFSGSLPAWVPTRPLLVGYLVARGVLQEQAADPVVAGSVNDPVFGWNDLIDRIARREAKQEAGISGPVVRQLLERLATTARASGDGLGPLTTEQMAAVFRDVCGYTPDEQGLGVLQRLPGLGTRSAAEGTRSFIDLDLADACRAGDVVAYVKSPYTFASEVFDDVEHSLDEIGIGVASLRLRQAQVAPGVVGAAVQRYRVSGDNPVHLGDLVRLASLMHSRLDSTCYIRGTLMNELHLEGDGGDLSTVTFDDCYFGRISLDAGAVAEQLPRFKSCYVKELDGRVSAQDLPPGVFDEACVFESFSQELQSTKSIMSLQLPIGVKVVLSILRKLYLRKGAGRRESALYRGLDLNDRRHVPAALSLLKSHGLALPHKAGDSSVWHPARNKTARVLQLLAAPTDCKDAVLCEASKLT